MQKRRNYKKTQKCVNVLSITVSEFSFHISSSLTLYHLFFSISVSLWAFLLSAKQIVEGHWLAFERESPAGKEHWEIKKRMIGVIKQNLMDVLMTDWAELSKRR